MSAPTSTKPYLLRAVYEWCVDNGLTPHLSVIVDARTRVPKEHVKNGEIVLNIGQLATDKLKMGNDAVEFFARFGGVARQLYVPMSAIAGIYARENGQGMFFDVAREQPSAADAGAFERPSATTNATTTLAAVPPNEDPPPIDPPPGQSPGGGKPALRRVK